MRSRKAIFLLPFAIFAAGAQADSLPITPGLWETVVVTTNPMTGSTTNTTTECVVEESFDPESFMEDTQGCKVVENQLSGDTLTFSMECNLQGAQGIISGVFQTSGDSATGEMTTTVNFSGQQMSFGSTWTGTRVGNC